jgi:hypothetical protein
MKKLLPLLFLLPIFCNAQQGATSQDEYNYITKGIADLASKGLQQRSDYWFKAWPGQPSFLYQTTFGGNEVFNFQFLMRQNDMKPCAVILGFTKNNVTVNYCLPAPMTQLTIVTECRNDLLRLLGSGDDRAFNFMWVLLMQRISLEYFAMQ